jgi:hypothetical protein
MSAARRQRRSARAGPRIGAEVDEPEGPPSSVPTASDPGPDDSAPLLRCILCGSAPCWPAIWTPTPEHADRLGYRAMVYGICPRCASRPDMPGPVERKIMAQVAAHHGDPEAN